MTRAFLGGYYTEFEDVYHTDDWCPAGRLIPVELRKQELRNSRSWCASCRAREEAELARLSASWHLSDTFTLRDERARSGTELRPVAGPAPVAD